MKLHYTISGNDDDGWTLNVYKRVQDYVTTYWQFPKNYNSLEDLADELDKLRNSES